MPREFEQLSLGLRSRYAHDCANLAIRNLPGGERLTHERKLGEPPCHAHMLTRGTQPDRATPREPVRARTDAPFGPAEALIELRNELQPATRRRCEMGSKLAYFALEVFKRGSGLYFLVVRR